jgi:hypothetical protein
MTDLRGIKVTNFKAFEKNTLQGIFDLELPFGGIVLRGCTFHRKADKHWIGFPGKPFTKQDGLQSWSNIVDFTDNKAKYLLQDEILPLVLTAAAGAGNEPRTARAPMG